ncbi:hypothetical protein LTR49_017443 [Elasticomyces elasticus]|nr:hypothetical protein LTR49_017443 [Elasticomyces elasticus]
MSEQLCECCRQIDLTKLFAPADPDKIRNSGRSLREHEEDRAILIPGLTFADALKHTTCDFCKLIVECAVRADLRSHFVSTYDQDWDWPNLPEWATSSMVDRWEFQRTKTTPSRVRCCLRPKLVWSAKPTSEDGVTCRHSLACEGQFYIWWYKHRSIPKLVKLKITKQNGVEALNTAECATTNPDTEKHTESKTTRAGGLEWKEIKSGIASWIIDLVSLPWAQEHHLVSTTIARRVIEKRVYLDRVRLWLQRCNASHDHTSMDTLARARIKQIPAQYTLRAINTTTHEILPLPPNAKYAALSYVWGSGTVQLVRRGFCASLWTASIGLFGPELSSHNVADYSSIPRTIRDALDLAFKLGYQWLWVDRLCIDQNQELEKLALIPAMSAIFALAEFTIVAAHGDDSTAGLPGLGDTERWRETVYELKLANAAQPVRVIPALPSFNTMQEQSCWRTRGWTFEEQVFSRRILYVFSDEMWFSCERSTYRESAGEKSSVGSAGSTWDASGAPPSIASVLQAKFHSDVYVQNRAIDARDFVLAVEHYTSRELTFEEDRITAFAGVITVQRSPIDHMADRSLLLHGHPLDFFETALTWHREDDDAVLRTPRNSKPFAPSWSWASAGAKINFLDDGRDHSRNRWFRYTILNGHDVIGLPAGTDMANNLKMPYPADLLASQPWNLAIPPPPYVASMRPSLRILSPQLPRLHLLTVIFNAQLQSTRGGQLRMSAEGDDNISFDGGWSLKPGFPRKHDEHATMLRNNTDEQSRAGLRTGDSTPQKLAVVGGYNSVYIMLLAPTREENVFSRLGLTRLSLLYLERHLGIILRRGHAAWRYIQLV